MWKAIGSFIVAMVKWLKSFFEDEKGNTSSKRLALIATTYCTNYGSLLILKAVAQRYLAQGGDISLIIGAALGCACALSGVSYVWGQYAAKAAAPATPADNGGDSP